VNGIATTAATSTVTAATKYDQRAP
jgi:hypothetical protein